MQREEALKRFVRENASKLASPQTTAEVVKRMRQDFFDRHSLKSGDRFRNMDVAEEVVKMVLRKGVEKGGLSIRFGEDPIHH